MIALIRVVVNEKVTFKQVVNGLSTSLFSRLEMLDFVYNYDFGFSQMIMTIIITKVVSRICG